MAANIATVNKVGFEQLINDKALAVFDTRPVDQTMCIDGVRCLFDRFEIDDRTGPL